MSLSPAETRASQRALDGQTYAHVPPLPAMVARLHETYASAPDTARDSGALWYPRFAEVARILADRFGVTKPEAAAVLAWTSPRVPVHVNVERARDVLASWQADRDPLLANPQGLVEHASYGVECLEGDWSSLDLDVGALTEYRKVRSFFRNILGETDPVTLDVWALRAVGVQSTGVLTGGAYIAVATAYRIVAADLGITPRDLQAVVWTAVRHASGSVTTDDIANEQTAILEAARAEPTLGPERVNAEELTPF